MDYCRGIICRLVGGSKEFRYIAKQERLDEKISTNKSNWHTELELTWNNVWRQIAFRDGFFSEFTDRFETSAAVSRERRKEQCYQRHGQRTITQTALHFIKLILKLTVQTHLQRIVLSEEKAASAVVSMER